LTVGLGNHPGTAAEDLYELYRKRFHETSSQDRVTQNQKAIKGRVIKTSHIRSPGLGWIVMHEDATDETEKQWMAELREKTLASQNMRFDAALSHMTHGLSMYDADHRLVICNQRYREMYGMPDEMVRPGARLGDILAYRKQLGPRSG